MANLFNHSMPFYLKFQETTNLIKFSISVSVECQKETKKKKERKNEMKLRKFFKFNLLSKKFVNENFIFLPLASLRNEVLNWNNNFFNKCIQSALGCSNLLSTGRSKILQLYPQICQREAFWRRQEFLEENCWGTIRPFDRFLRFPLNFPIVPAS